MQIRIYYEDTDAGGVVYHANYLKFCERARSQIFFDARMLPTQEGGHFVVSRIEADFLRPAKLGDLIRVETSLLEMGKVSLRLKQQLLREDELLFSAIIKLGFVKDGRLAPIPQEYAQLLRSLKGVI
ncbi:MAG: YbgC/FadM family acyl-CoA thioesterase [Campylobacterales bacterium]